MAEGFYLKQLIDKNVGPLTDVRIDFPFNDNGNPKPIILVGENGTGKSTIISNIVDAFFEMAGKAFDNANQPNERTGYQYFKAISPTEIHVGKPFMYSYISFASSTKLNYIHKAGYLPFAEFKKQIGDEPLTFSWNDMDNVKKVTDNQQLITRIWDNNVICYFGPERYEKPAWMGNRYYYMEDALHPTIENKWSRSLNNPIIVQDVTSTNLQWLLDVITDSRLDIAKAFPVSKNINELGIDDDALNRCYTEEDFRNTLFSCQARRILAKILSIILGEDVMFQLNKRNRGGSRFIIVRESDESVVCPSLDSLSTGQSALFNMFSSIVRYADNNDINKSHNLQEITGVVIIDEIELHLHSKLQKEALPKLIQLFPKIQFVITSHSPLFLLGMKDTFGEDGFEVLEMPSATRIDIEKFSEFQKAFDYLKETSAYQQAVKNALNEVQKDGKAVVVTEGSTDWKHLKAAFERIKLRKGHQDLPSEEKFEFFEFEAKNSLEEAKFKLNMGKDTLCQICESISQFPQPVKYIFIADRDDEATNKKLSVPEASYKNWGNNVYSFVLPIPPHRTETPAICIEHYYTDDEIKTEWTDPESGIKRRLFLGNEFDERGIAQSIDRFCDKRNKCGCTSIAVIEGSIGKKVTSIHDNNGINYALPKTKFAKMILEKQTPFNNFNFENFVKVFEIIKRIIDDNQEDNHA